MNKAVVLILIMFLTACGGKIFKKASGSLVLDGALSYLAALLACAAMFI